MSAFEVIIQGVHKRFQLDTDASISLVQSGTSKVPLCWAILNPHGVTGKEFHVLGTQMIEFTIGNYTFGHEFIASYLPILEGLLGSELLLGHEIVINDQNQDIFVHKIKLYSLYKFNQINDTSIPSNPCFIIRQECVA
jgi:hypothetical protein